MPKGLILPYVIEDSRKGHPFTREMEAAVLLALAHGGKRRPIIPLSGPETLEFIMKALYPIWAVPWDDRSIIIDGLNLSSDKLTRLEIPDVKAFTEEIMRGSRSPKSYVNVLRRGLKKFWNPLSPVEVSVEGFIGDVHFLEELCEVLRGKGIRGARFEETLAPIPPKVDLKDARERAERFTWESRIVKSHVAALRYAVKVLEGETARFRERVKRETEHLTRVYAEKIASAREAAEKRIRDLRKRMDAELKKTEKAYTKIIKEALKRRESLEKTVRRLEGAIETYLERRESSRRKGSKRGVKYWDGKVKKYRRMLSEAKSDLREVERLVREINWEMEKRLDSVKDGYRSLIAQEAEKVNALEACMKVEVGERRRLLEEVEELTSKIKSRIELAIEDLTRALMRLTSRTAPWKFEEATIIWVPSYIVKYRSQKGERYKVYPPVNIKESEGVLKWVRRAIFSFNLESRMFALIQPRSGAFERRLFKTLEEALEADKALRETIDGIGKSENLLKKEGFKTSAIEGLEALKAEGWITLDERNDLLSTYLTA